MQTLETFFSQFLHYPVAHLFQRRGIQGTEVPCRGLGGINEVSFKRKVNQNLFIVSGCDVNKQATERLQSYITRDLLNHHNGLLNVFETADVERFNLIGHIRAY